MNVSRVIFLWCKKYMWEKKIRFTRADWKRGILKRVLYTWHIENTTLKFENNHQWCCYGVVRWKMYLVFIARFSRNSSAGRITLNASHEGKRSVVSRYLRESVTIFHVTRIVKSFAGDIPQFWIWQLKVISRRYFTSIGLLNLRIWWKKLSS